MSVNVYVLFLSSSSLSLSSSYYAVHLTVLKFRFIGMLRSILHAHSLIPAISNCGTCKTIDFVPHLFTFSQL